MRAKSIVSGALGCFVWLTALGSAIAQRQGRAHVVAGRSGGLLLELKNGENISPRPPSILACAVLGVACSSQGESGHHHLLIDTDLPPLDQPIPADFNHLHFGAGQTEAEVTLHRGITLYNSFWATKIISRIRRL